MQKYDVDMVGSKALERALHRLTDQTGRPFFASDAIDVMATLGNQSVIISSVADTLADKLLRARVARGCVDEVDARVKKNI